MIRELDYELEDRTSCESAFCIIGGGLAGLLAAAKLVAAGRRVIVVESGGHKPDRTSDDLNEADQLEATYQTAVTGRTRSLGGTSTIWGGRMLPLTAHDLAARDYLDLEAWPITKADLDCFLPQIELLFGLDNTSYEGSAFRLDRPLGFHTADDDLAARWAKWPPFRRRNIAKRLRQRLEAASGFKIWLGATVCDFILNREVSRVSGVVARSRSGKSLRVMADRFIIAAGTLETTRLLLLLDRTSEHRVFASTNALGRYFNDHMAVEAARLQVVDAHHVNRLFGYHIGGSTRRSLHLETTAAAQRHDRAASGYVTVRPEYQDRSLHQFVRSLGRSAQKDGRKWVPPKGVLGDLASVVPAAYWRARFGQMYLSRRVDLFVDVRVEQVPSLQSRLSLSHSRVDPFGVPLLNIDWRKSSIDEHTLRSVLRRMRRHWNSSGLDAVSPLVWATDPDKLNLLLDSRVRDTCHPAGSTRMGHNPAYSVVSSRLQCHAVPNVFVASAATFPSSGSANPSLTIMQLALRATEAALSTT